VKTQNVFTMPKPIARCTSPHLVERGHRLEALRRRAGFESVNAASYAVRIDSPALRSYERGERDMRLSHAERIAAAYGCTVAEIVGETFAPTKEAA